MVLQLAVAFLVCISSSFSAFNDGVDILVWRGHLLGKAAWISYSVTLISQSPLVLLGCDKYCPLRIPSRQTHWVTM